MASAHAWDISYGTAWKKEETATHTLAALRAGFRALDTANQPKHYNEAQVGDALAAFTEERRLAGAPVAREDFFIQTKFTHVSGQDPASIPYDRYKDEEHQLRDSLRLSLQHLRVDYLDSLLLHGVYSSGENETDSDGMLSGRDWRVWRAMEAAQEEGLVRAIGISNVNPSLLEDLLSQAKIPPALVQNRCTAATAWDQAVRDLCRAHNVQYQGFGLLTWSRHVMERPIVLALAEKLSKTPAQIVLRFAQQLSISPLVGPKSEAHMRDDLQISDFSLSPSELRAIELIGGKEEGAVTATFKNHALHPVHVFWVGHDGNLVEQGVLQPRGSKVINTFDGHSFVAHDADGSVLLEWKADRVLGPVQDVMVLERDRHGEL